MNFREFRLLSEAKKDLYAEIGKDQTDKLLNTKVDPKIHSMHDHVFGAGNHHIEMPLENDVPEKVKGHIESQGDSLEGDQVKLKSGRLAPISKYLAKSKAPKDVSDEHENWARNKSSNSKLVITRHAAEVASASTGTHWSSCAKATPADSRENRPAWDAMPSELTHGTLMAMHVHKDAKPDADGNYASKDVLGRTLIKRHDSDTDHSKTSETSFHREGKSYGTFPESAKKAVDAFTAKNYPQNTATANKERTLYNDDGVDTKVNHNHPDIKHAFDPNHHLEASKSAQIELVGSNSYKVPSEHILDLAASSRHNEVRNHVANYSTNPDTIRKAFHNAGRGDDAWTQTNAAHNIHAPVDVIDVASTHDKALVRRSAVGHKRATSNHIMAGLKDRDPTVQEAAAANPNLTKEHVNHILDNVDKTHADGKPVISPHAVDHVIRSQNISSEHIKNLLHHETHGKSAIWSPHITKEHLLHALDSPSNDVAQAVMKHSLVDHDVLAKAVIHTHPLVVLNALMHHKMTPALFDHARTHPNPHMAAFVDGMQKSHHTSKSE